MLVTSLFLRYFFRLLPRSGVMAGCAAPFSCYLPPSKYYYTIIPGNNSKTFFSIRVLLANARQKRGTFCFPGPTHKSSLNLK